MNKKILISLSLIAVVGVIAIGATVSYFTDTESSVGNVFTAGSIDLKIDNHAWFNGAYMQEFSWELNDLTDHLFFYYTDLKPGDWEEDTISIRVDNNPAWVCGEITITKNDDMTCTEPEYEDDPDCDEPDEDIMDGDLAQDLVFIYWVDDGDNVLEDDECFNGPISPGALLPDGSIRFPIADINYSIAGYDPKTGLGLPIAGLETYYIAKAFCFGDIEIVPIPQDEYGDQMNPGGPQGPGFTCNGALVNNASQSDSLTGDISFTAVQYRNNTDFVCVVKPQCEEDIDCNDKNECTEDICIEGFCQNTCSVGQVCDDGNEYTHGDVCTETIDGCVCVGEPECTVNADCDDDNACTSDVCDENGVCQHDCLVGQSCNDGNRLTINDVCVLDSGCPCQGTPVACIDATDCDDELPCTIDTCENNVCVHTAIDCDDDNLCTDDSCNPLTGECVNESIVCNDNNSCTTDSCNPDTGCVYTSICDGTDTDCGCETCVNCNDQDGWYPIGSTYTCCNGNRLLCDTCNDEEYRDYYCSGYSCTYSVIQTQTITSGCSLCPNETCCVAGECGHPCPW